MNSLIVNGKEFESRLFTGTGKFSSSEVMKKSIDESGSQMVTVALRRVDLDNPQDNILSYLDRDKIQILPNTSGARDSIEAIRLAKLARASGIGNWLKLEVIPDPNYLLPDAEETLKAAKILVKEGFIVLPYIQADPVLAKKLEECGCSTVMPLGSPIGTNKGISTIEMIKIIIEQANIPVVVDAGLGAPSHAALAMEIGADAVLVNTAIAAAADPVIMGRAFKKAVEAGREAYEGGLAAICRKAEASSPLTGFLRD